MGPREPTVGSRGVDAARPASGAKTAPFDYAAYGFGRRRLAAASVFSSC